MEQMKMGYPALMQPSIEKARASRKERVTSAFPELTVAEKAKLLEDYHPDFNQKVKRPLKIGVNKGDPVPTELADLIEAPGRLKPEQIDLSRVDHWLATGAQPSERVNQLIRQARRGGATEAQSA